MEAFPSVRSGGLENTSGNFLSYYMCLVVHPSGCKGARILDWCMVEHTLRTCPLPTATTWEWRWAESSIQNRCKQIPNVDSGLEMTEIANYSPERGFHKLCYKNCNFWPPLLCHHEKFTLPPLLSHRFHDPLPTPLDDLMFGCPRMPIYRVGQKIGALLRE